MDITALVEEMPNDVCDLEQAQAKCNARAKSWESFQAIHQASRVQFGKPPRICDVTSVAKENRAGFDVLQLFERKEAVKIIAPMVKYSRAEFRRLCRTYGCQLGFTPMVITEDMAKTGNWTRSDLYSTAGEEALIVQLASCNAVELSQCAQKVYWGCDGIDINVGRNIGSALLDDFALVADMIKNLKASVPTCQEKPFSVSIKIRIVQDFQKTIDLCQKAEHAGVSFITVHGRYPHQRDNSYPADWNAIRAVKDAVSVPVVANGDVQTAADYARICTVTNCDGVMSANGLLGNPALFHCDETPIECILRWFALFDPPHSSVLSEDAVEMPASTSPSVPVLRSDTSIFHETQVSNRYGFEDDSFLMFHNHIIRMLPVADKREKSIIASFKNRGQIADFLLNEWHLSDKLKEVLIEMSGKQSALLGSAELI